MQLYMKDTTKQIGEIFKTILYVFPVTIYDFRPKISLSRNFVINRGGTAHINVTLRYVTYCECEALVNQHAMCTPCAILSSLSCPALQYFSTLSHKRRDFRGGGGGGWLKKGGFFFFYNFFWKIFYF
jgi:hypothetical protein